MTHCAPTRTSASISALGSTTADGCTPAGPAGRLARSNHCARRAYSR
ncbi:Uncharacterised protein [Bordetella pertussis]|nr:Uncharacterised protein [Bordetella pertussis]